MDRKHANFFVACRGCSITPVNFTELRLVFDLGVDIVYLGRERRNENQSPRLISSDDKIPRGIRIEKRMELISIIRDVSIRFSIYSMLKRIKIDTENILIKSILNKKCSYSFNSFMKQKMNIYFFYISLFFISIIFLIIIEYR